MNLKPPEQFLFSPNHLLRNGADNRSGRSTWSATCLISNLLIKPRNLDILTNSGLKAVGRLSPTPTTEVETRDGSQETLEDRRVNVL